MSIHEGAKRLTWSPSEPIKEFAVSISVLFIYLCIKNICVCNAQLMQKAQQSRYKTVAAI